MAQVLVRDHAYGPDAGVQKAPTVTLNNIPPSSPGITGLPSSLVFTPPSNIPPTPSSRIVPESPSSSSTGYRLGTPPTSPASGIFARRGSLLPKVGESSKGTPQRSLRVMTEEGMEMRPVKSNAQDEVKLKEDQALAKWRRWVIEQPPQHGQPSLAPPPPPQRPRQSSKGSTPNRSPALSPNQSRQNSTNSPISPSRSPTDRNSPAAMHRPSIQDGDESVFNTESVLALRDVELAIDENILNATQGRARLGSRRMSVVPPPYPESNPFYDIAHRLSTRRVRPLVLELIQALGHYIDATWSLANPGKPCPWAEGTKTSPQPDGNDQPEWSSKMVTAVRGGKKTGHVSSPATYMDVQFWESEVRYGLKDVDAVVGIYHGAAWAFNAAVEEGRYGEVHAENVMRAGEHGGGMTRLLHDLEEAFWGEAVPRSTDLAYDLPGDFDPYAIVEDEPPSQVRPTPSPQENPSDPMLTVNGLTKTSSNLSANGQRRTISVNAWDTALNLDAFKKEDEEQVSLEELGRRRHREWVERNKGSGWAV